MGNDVLKALAYFNGLVIAGASAISLTTLTPLAVDIALGLVAASTFAVAGWLAAFTVRAVRGDDE